MVWFTTLIGLSYSWESSAHLPVCFPSLNLGTKNMKYILLAAIYAKIVLSYFLDNISRAEMGIQCLELHLVFIIWRLLLLKYFGPSLHSFPVQHTWVMKTTSSVVQTPERHSPSSHGGRDPRGKNIWTSD